jgi:hypothetical protein
VTCVTHTPPVAQRIEPVTAGTTSEAGVDVTRVTREPDEQQ